MVDATTEDLAFIGPLNGEPIRATKGCCNNHGRTRNGVGGAGRGAPGYALRGGPIDRVPL
jgi:hypothetical protein